MGVKICIRREAAPLLKTSVNVGLYLDPGASIPPKAQDATPPIQFIYRPSLLPIPLNAVLPRVVPEF